MCARWLGTGVLAALALVPALAGCGGVSNSTAAENVGSQLTIYSSLPLQGPEGSISQQIVGGEKLALSDAQGHVGRFTVSYTSLDDSSPTTGEWDPGVTASNAKAAAQDPTTIAYLGDFNSGATAVSLPLTNAAGILQVSPASPYVGLTSSFDANQGEPERFYLTGKRTFGRIAPGDTVQAAAQVELLRRLGVRTLYLIADQDPFDTPLTAIVEGDAEHAGIKVVGDDTITIAPGSSFSGEVKKVSESGAQAVFVSATATEEAAEPAAACLGDDEQQRVHRAPAGGRKRDVHRLAAAADRSLSALGAARVGRIPASLRRGGRSVCAVRLRDDECRAGRDPRRRRGRRRSSGSDRQVLRHARSPFRARCVLNTAERRNDSLHLRH